VSEPARWLLLLHQIPPRPGYFRAKVMRRLVGLGALPVKKSAYLLPETDETLEDFQWLLREIRGEGGEAWVFRCEVVAGETDEQLREAFRAQRAADWSALAEQARALLPALRARATSDETTAPDAGWERLRRDRQALERIDFFGAPGRSEVEALLSEIEDTLRRPAQAAGGSRAAGGEPLRGRTWVTRTGVNVDRIASAWLIRRFVDPAARFAFVDPKSYRAAPGEIRFDMFEGEYTHEADRCTFEVLIERNGLSDPALAALGEIVHDVDVKDGKFGRLEAPGLAALIAGLVERVPDDGLRVEEGMRLFDALYAGLRGGARDA
jgi:hypothetical protein